MADVTSTFAAKDVGFASTVNKMQGSLAGFQKGIASFAVKAAALVAGFVAARSAAQAFGAAIQMGGQLNDLAARTGETAGNLAILQRAFQNAGASSEQVGTTLNKLQRAIIEAGQGITTYARAFEGLGLSYEELASMSPTEQLQAVAGALNDLSNPTERSAVALQLLGRSGGELIPLLRAMGTELETARQQLGSTPAIIDATNKDLDTIGDNFAAIAEKGKEFMLGLLQDLAPAIADVTTRLANIDAAGFGAKLSEYIESTARWIAETFRLGEALANVETAVNAITSGNFGDGLRLMFLTARDTALNAINQIVAAATAALQTLGGALQELFAPDSVTMAFINGSFEMLGAKIATGIFDSIATVLEKLPFMQAAAEAVREAQSEAEQAIEDISNIMYYEADNLKSEWGGIMAEMPKAFADSYKANMEQPLFDMRDRAEETADQMERAAAATRAAAFDAENFAQSLRDARLDQLAGDAPDSPFPDFTRGGGAATPTTLIAADKPDSRSRKGGASRGGRSSVSAPVTQDQAVAQMRADAARDRATRRVGDFMERGAFRSAAAAMERGDRAANRILQGQRERDVMSDMFGAKNISDSLRNFERDARNAGMTPDEALSRMGVDREFGEDRVDALNRFVQEQAKTPEERARAEQAMRDKNAPGGGRASDPISQIYTLLTTHLPKIDEKLPQHALA